MKNLIIIALVVIIVAAAGAYVYREKKKGKKCIGCPEGGNCTSGDCASCNVHR
ncbi:MAG: FeoB-associated Cys-rich membrane protein [Ruminococcaceae bacterium]|nr:FeoB-associated Cys-rich membrane protein [Oscillospiraceae bacterium]